MFYLQFQNQKYKDQRIVAFVGANPPIDPEETKIKIQPLILESDEFKAHQKLADSKMELLNRHQKLLDEYRIHRRNATKVKEINDEYALVGTQLNELEPQLVSSFEQIEAKRYKLFNKHAVHSAPGNSILISDDDAKEWLKLLHSVKQNELLLENKEIIKKEQFEISRISELSNEKKQNEKTIKISLLVKKAIAMRSELEIQSDPEALTKSQQWFNAEKQKIEDLYTE